MDDSRVSIAEIEKLKAKLIAENGNYDFWFNNRELQIFTLVFDSLLEALSCDVVQDCGTLVSRCQEDTNG